MADDLGAVRRTPRPTGDRQTPETVAQLPRGATNAPTPVSTDAANGTDDLSPEAEAALIEQHGPEIQAIADAFHELRGKLHATAVLGHVHTTGNDMQAFLELPDCTACGGTGKDDHATPFEGPLAVHFAGPPVRAERRLRQLCMWCGHVLIDASLKDEIQLTPWSVGVFVKVEDGYGVELPHEPGGELPPGCCALPDDEEPRGYGERVCRRCDVQAAFCPCTKPDVADESSAEHCGKHVPGTSSNRCLLRPGHTGDHSGEFETPDDEPARAYLDDAEHDDIWPRWCKFVFLGKRCTFAPGHQELWHRLPDGTEVNNEGEPMADEAQETRAADWPAEETDRG